MVDRKEDDYWVELGIQGVIEEGRRKYGEEDEVKNPVEERAPTGRDVVEDPQ